MRLVLQALAAIAAYVALAAVLSHVLVRPARVNAAPRTITREPAQPGRATLLFLGDTGLGDAAQPLLEAEGYDVPLRSMVDLVRGADLAVANLEMPITKHRRRFAMYKRWRYHADEAAAKALAWSGLDVVELANNHSTDEDDEGLFDTLRLARDAGMEPVGAGGDESEARRGLVVHIGALRVGILAYCERQLVWELFDDQFARRGRAGVAALTEAGLRDDLARMKPLVDVMVVSLHIGENYEPPTADALEWSERAIDLGADLVVNHHPHLAHPLTLYKGHPIALSLGNWVFGTPGHDELEVGQMLFVELSGTHIDRLAVLPLDVQNTRVAFRPRPMTGAALDAALSSLIDASAARGAHLTRVENRAVLELR